MTTSYPPKNLFICATPLQTLIATQIIKEENIDKSLCDIIYLAFNDNTINQKYFLKFAEGTKNSIYISSGRTLSTVLQLRRFLFNQEYNAYMANIDDTLWHYALSFIKLKKLVTFDDGTANIIPSSSFFVGIKKPPLRGFFLKIAHYLMGNRYSIDKIKRQTFKHYSIYPGYTNAVPKTHYISLFDKPTPATNEKTINIFLGTVYSEATKSQRDSLRLQASVIKLLEQFTHKYIYIPHPREDISNIHKGIITLKNNLIAEEYILQLTQEYQNINIYGFGSSAQFNLLNTQGINIFPVTSKLLKDSLYDTLALLENCSNPAYNID
ncbi:glycosyltransferase family 52 [Pelistega sp. MC2]|uniref:glycosyltransferase family 52 n=1 Tax=Pelistega sp. MC2 TaxID=1720297 RepID=UPI0008D96384|nr:glycosyltransferase family 52 [Pelistega sp. MC2]